jgi:membrane associated rhomboid family serine protease
MQSGFLTFEDWGRLDPSLLRGHGAVDWLALREEGQWWRLVTGALLHGAWWHLAFNLWALLVLGSMVERRLGLSTWLTVVSSSTVMGGLAAMAWGDANMVVGVSGVVFGLGGVLLAAPRDSRGARTARTTMDAADALGSRKRLGPPLSAALGAQTGIESDGDAREGLGGGDAETELSLRELAFWLGLTLAAGAFWAELSQAGHIGGLLGGGLVGLGLRSRPAQFLAPLIWIGVVLGSLEAILADPDSSGGQERLAYALLDAERYEAAWSAFDAALEQDVEDTDRRGRLLNAGAYARALGSTEAVVLKRGLEMVDESLGLDAASPDRLDTRGWLLCRMRDQVEGQAALADALAASDGDPSVELLEHIESCSQ